MDTFQDLLGRNEKDPEFFLNLITVHLTWIYMYDPEPKHKSSHWKSPSLPRPNEARQDKTTSLKREEQARCFPPTFTEFSIMKLFNQGKLYTDIIYTDTHLRENAWRERPTYSASSMRVFLAKGK